MQGRVYQGSNSATRNPKTRILVRIWGDQRLRFAGNWYILRQREVDSTFRPNTHFTADGPLSFYFGVPIGRIECQVPPAALHVVRGVVELQSFFTIWRNRKDPQIPLIGPYNVRNLLPRVP